MILAMDRTTWRVRRNSEMLISPHLAMPLLMNLCTFPLPFLLMEVAKGIGMGMTSDMYAFILLDPMAEEGVQKEPRTFKAMSSFNERYYLSTNRPLCTDFTQMALFTWLLIHALISRAASMLASLSSAMKHFAPLAPFCRGAKKYYTADIRQNSRRDTSNNYNAH